MRITIASLHGSPGATTAAVSIAAHWPEAEMIPTVVECDPAGGDLALRHRLGLHPGLSDVAAAIASGSCDPAQALTEGVQTIRAASTHLPVVVAAPGGEEARSALPVLTSPGLKVLNPPGGIVIADAGRCDPHSPAWPIVTGADLALFVVEGTLNGVSHLRYSLGQLRLLESVGVPVALAVRERDYTSIEVADAFRAQGLDLRVLGPLGPNLTEAPDRRPRRSSRTPARWKSLALAVSKAADDRPLALTAGQPNSDNEAER